MKTTMIVCLLVLGAFAAHAPLKHSTLSEKNSKTAIEDLQKSKSGITILKLAQLHAQAQGPVQELLEALDSLVDDLNDSVDELDLNFRRRTAEHNSLVIKFTQDIQDADIDIQRSEDVVSNLLLPRKNQLKQRIAQVVSNQEENRKTVQENALIRKQENEAFLAQVEELNGATESVDEALALISTLSNPSLMQVKKFQNSLKKVEGKINSRGRLAPMIKALISLASNQNFSSQDIVKQIVTALNDFRNEVVDSINDLTAHEADSVEDFNERNVQLDEELAEFQRQLIDLTNNLNATNSKLEQTTAFEQQRITDKKSYTEQLNLENDSYAVETQVFQDLKAEYLREIAVTEQARSVVASADLSGIKVF